MKVLPELYPTDFDAPPANEINLPQGIIGFATYKRAELLYLPDHLPFLWMKLHGPTDNLHFIVIELRWCIHPRLRAGDFRRGRLAARYYDADRGR